MWLKWHQLPFPSCGVGAGGRNKQVTMVLELLRPSRPNLIRNPCQSPLLFFWLQDSISSVVSALCLTYTARSPRLMLLCSCLMNSGWSPTNTKHVNLCITDATVCFCLCVFAETRETKTAGQPAVIITCQNKTQAYWLKSHSCVNTNALGGLKWVQKQHSLC